MSRYKERLLIVVQIGMIFVSVFVFYFMHLAIFNLLLEWPNRIIDPLGIF